MTEAASRIAADPAVRAALVQRQRALIGGGDWVAEGRDIGTVVAPAAELKIFLDASPEERARRRAEQSGRAAADVLAEQQDRDARDRGRETSRWPRPDAIPIDTTGLSLPEVVDRIVTLTTQVRAGEAVR